MLLNKCIVLFNHDLSRVQSADDGVDGAMMEGDNLEEVDHGVKDHLHCGGCENI